MLIFNSKNLSIYIEDFFKIFLYSYKIILCYFYRGAMENLKLTAPIIILAKAVLRWAMK